MRITISAFSIFIHVHHSVQDLKMKEYMALNEFSFMHLADGDGGCENKSEKNGVDKVPFLWS